jgi:hypothetical protein
MPDTKKSNLITAYLSATPYPLTDYSPFPQSHGNSPSLGISLAAYCKPKKKKFPAGPTGATIVILSIQKAILE